ncbi:OmpA family protein [Flavobacterium sp. TAB 87]|uniref:outer membrane beta-barrel protein n=1 Tax=Flavobacterium sp. TAB 87 TaxID=1729581 RepID=UPI00076CE5E0|nr:OmpA family protein [Flavobacterium sp. TAB 87]KVV13620.1 proteobacterial sortase system OmpA family protein [Flavobacterium sp. TAB 87]
MINIYKYKKEPYPILFCSHSLVLRHFMVAVLVLVSSLTSLQAQDTDYSKPSWYFGAVAGANFNFFEGSTQKMNAAFTPPVAFHDGDGIGLFAAPLIEYRPANSKWGIMFQAGYDSRKGSFDQVLSDCNCPADLKTDLSYITLEPSVRFAPFKSGFYLYGGPRLAFNVDKSFTYQLHANPAFPNQIEGEAIKGDFSDVEKTILSIQIGAGYDIPLTASGKKTQFVLSPFVAFQPYFGQHPRSVETWNITTVRAGVALKFGTGTRSETLEVIDSESQFSINSPSNYSERRPASEIFPLRNYVFFDEGSSQIPARYELLRKEQVKDFKEDQLKVSNSENLSERSKRQMIVYYNVLNILGDRMQKNPSAKITLVGSSDKGQANGLEMATAIQSYLVNVFEISSERILVEGREKPKNPSEQPGGTRELELLREGDRRVSIESNSPVLLMEFQNGPNAPLKPVVINAPQEAPLESYVVFQNAGATEAFSSWNMELKDENGKIKNFGPYTEDTVSLPTATILGSRSQGDYTAKMIGTTKSGKLSEKEVKTHVTLWTPATFEQGIRYSIIYDFNESKATNIYERYLSDIVTTQIPIGATVLIKGYTDIIGEETYNQELSLARANDTKTIIESSLSKAGRNDVKFVVNGFGENPNDAPFDNKFPEERFYNRTVIIDIIPAK